MTPEQITLMREAASRACALLKVLGNEDRLLLLCQMVDGEKCVSDFEALLDIRQPTLSQQLGVLRNEGLVSTRRDGKRIFYSIASPEAQQMLNVLYGMYCPVDLGKQSIESDTHAN
ncbi:ArsR/SmtB family transcription factor [Chitinilyticum piscinae]|uniref:Helix-turn-helix transcriptional regulator n=1 Tax=Chitinilyticum piscinae TaxID=2866724 RepID=A0A8J7FL22_9NEIS|nr:metalloregulator ArsR/SmtB family transcription factor [Chitinilyticum piscinae]MBE9609762.1 helix-turn-helix transcriptional regulator [Chitinilyticum piscinae]